MPNHRLGTLARYFRTMTEPNHRALQDARATVEVLHALIGRLGSHRVFTLEETIEFAKAITPAQRKKRYLAEGLPDVPGVYLFRDGKGRPLYIGTSNSILTRVRSYFTAAESRKRISEMIHIAERVDPVECAHSLEAEIRELRLIAIHKPPYNRRSKFPERTTWLKLTAETFPRLSMVARVKDDGAGYLGPFGSRHAALLAMDAVYEAIPLRQCRRKLSAKLASPACVLAELGRCAAPCELRVSREEYHRQAVEPFARALAGDPGELVRGLLARIETLAGRHRYEQAAQVRARMAALLRATVRMQRLTALTALTEVVAARPAGSRPGRPDGGWEIAVIRYGRLVAAGTSVPPTHPRTHTRRTPGNRRNGAPRSRPDPVRQCRRDRTAHFLAGASRGAAGRMSTRVDLPGQRRRPLRRPARTGRGRATALCVNKGTFYNK